MPNCRTLVLYYWDKVVQAANAPSSAVQDSEDVIFPIRFLTQGLLLFKDSVAQWSPSRQTDAQEVLPKEFVEDAVRLIVKRLLLLDEADLDKWIEDPEEWINIEEGDSDAWEFEIRVRTLKPGYHYQISNTYITISLVQKESSSL
jgi:hypothetical protein